MEINATGIKRKRGYPNKEIWKLAKHYDCLCLINSDAHHVNELQGPHIAKAEEFADELGLKVLRQLQGV
jgi:histidinol phosphatase-like PHP family hydrolase